MSVFDVNFSALVKQLVPVRLRQSRQLAWLNVLVIPVAFVYNLFRANRNNNLYMLAHNGQVCYVEASLNDMFDKVLRRIFITDGPYIDPVYLYLVTEGKPVYLYQSSELPPVGSINPIPLYLNSEVTSLGGVKFIVNVPVSVVFDMARLRALVDRDKLVGKNYSVSLF